MAHLQTGAVERKSIYPCDYDHLVPGLDIVPMFEPEMTKEEILLVFKIIALAERQLTVATAKTPVLVEQEEKHKWTELIEQTWLYRWDETATEQNGLALSDLLYAARCFLMCSLQPKVRPMSAFPDITELYMKVLLLGTNHTRARFEQEDYHVDVVQLEQRCASLIVYSLSPAGGVTKILEDLGKRALPPMDEMLAARIEPLRNVPNLVPLTERERVAREQQAEADAAAAKSKAENDSGKKKNRTQMFDSLGDDSDEQARQAAILEGTLWDVNEGNYWHVDKKTVIGSFTRMASRIFRNYWLQKRIFDEFPIRPAELLPKYPDKKKTNLRAWFQKVCKTEAGDGSDLEYKSLMYEHWLPLGSRQEVLRTMQTKHDFANSSTLLSQELGFNSSTSLQLIGRVKPEVVAADPENQAYEFLLLSKFGYVMNFVMQSDVGVPVNFKKDYLIMPAELCMYRKRLKCETTVLKPRLPILLRIMRRWWIHDFRVIDGKNTGEWVMCDDMEDALLKLMTLWETKYGSAVAAGNPLDDWIKEVIGDPEGDQDVNLDFDDEEA